MRNLWACLAVVALIGCEDFDKALNEPGRQNVVAPGDIASSGDVSAVQNATSGGNTAAPTASPASPANPQPAAESATNAPAAATAQPAAATTGSIIGKTTGKIVDLAEAKKNPKIVEIENKVTGSDPLTVTFNAYVSITSRASVLNFKHQMDILKETNGGNQYPPYKEAMQLMKQMKIEPAALPPYQLYGYDAKTGGLVLLEDKAEKIRLYKLSNIPLDEADKPFDVP